jgi:hypothetical protein
MVMKRAQGLIPWAFFALGERKRGAGLAASLQKLISGI